MVESSEPVITKQFLYTYLDYEGKNQETSLAITIPYEDECLEELVILVLNQMDPMMRYLDENKSKFC